MGFKTQWEILNSQICKKNKQTLSWLLSFETRLQPVEKILKNDTGGDYLTHKWKSSASEQSQCQGVSLQREIKPIRHKLCLSAISWGECLEMDLFAFIKLLKEIILVGWKKLKHRWNHCNGIRSYTSSYNSAGLFRDDQCDQARSRSEGGAF